MKLMYLKGLRTDIFRSRERFVVHCGPKNGKKMDFGVIEALFLKFGNTDRARKSLALFPCRSYILLTRLRNAYVRASTRQQILE